MTPLEHTLTYRLRAVAEFVPDTDPPMRRLIAEGRRRRRNARVAGWSTVAGAAASIAVSVATLASVTPAYAVQVQDDGSISVTANRIADPSEVNRQLREVTGGRAVILLEQDRCPAGSQGSQVITGTDAGLLAGARRPGIASVGSDARLRIKTQAVPAGQILVVSPVADLGSAEPRSWALRLYRQPGPTCVARQ